MRSVLVLGAGQVGTFSARAISAEGISVVAADLDPAPGFFARFGPSADVELVAADIRDVEAIRALISQRDVGTVVLCAGPVGEACTRDPQMALELNLHASRQVAQSALDTGVSRLVFISTLAVYGRPAVDRIAEFVPLQPLSDYGRSKAAAEEALIAFRDKGLDIRILRPCGTYGPLRIDMGSHSARFIESALFRAVYERELTVRVASDTADEYLYVKDLGRAIGLAALCDIDSSEFVFNVGSGRKTTVHDLRLALEKVVPELRVTIEMVESDQDRPIPPLDASRIRETLRFEPAYSLVEGLADYIQEVGLQP